MKNAITFELIVSIFRQRLVFTAVFATLANGLSDQGKRLTRLRIRLAQLRKIERSMLRYVSRTKQEDVETSGDKVKHKVIWVLWLQGYNDAPRIVKQCLDSICSVKNIQVNLITSDNLSEYTRLPKIILQKWEQGIITNTHLSDLIRADLLVRHGGIWLDATVYVHEGRLPSELRESWLCLYRTLKPGKDGHAIDLSSWAMSAAPNNPILRLTRDYLFDYWSSNNRLFDYFLFHIALRSSLNFYKQYEKFSFGLCNACPHSLQLNFFQEYDEDKFNSILAQSSIHKLTYKNLEKVGADTMLGKFLNECN